MLFKGGFCFLYFCLCSLYKIFYLLFTHVLYETDKRSCYYTSSPKWPGEKVGVLIFQASSNETDGYLIHLLISTINLLVCYGKLCY